MPQDQMVEKKSIREFLREVKKKYPEICYLDRPLAAYTSYQVGGKADALVIPTNIAAVGDIYRQCIQEKIPFFILGKGANILVHDQGIRGVVMSLEKCCNQLFHDDRLLYVGAGATVNRLVEYCEKNSIQGLDYMSGIPGTVGGALTMNAGAFVGEIGDRVVRIDAFDERGFRVRISREEAGFGYRRAEGLKGKLLLGCWLVVEEGDRDKLAMARRSYLERRADKQPLEHPSCGSVFKRPPGDYAGRLIEAVQGKGFTVGGAMVSPKHANFILNFNHATARDIYEVIWQVQQKVYKQLGIWLELEVKLVGFPEEDRKRVKAPSNELEK